MNAPNPSSTDRDFDALRRAQRAHEPSMEEILASIRSIIADDKEPSAASAPAQKPAAGPQIVYTNDSIPPARAAAIAPALPPAPPAEAAPPASTEPPVAVAALTPKVVWEKPSPTVASPPVVAPEAQSSPAPVEEEPLASEETDLAVADAFQALSATVAMQSSAMIEGLMREMLRPMLKSWLDDNLPSLVERLVRAEIQRVARGGR
jgi:cell pole-organizing protein PopZ